MADYQMLGVSPEKSDRLKMWVRGLAIMGAASFKRRGSNWSAPTELFIHLELRRAERTSCCCIGLKEKDVMVGSVPSDLASTVKLSSTPSGTSGKLERSNKVPHWIK